MVGQQAEDSSNLVRIILLDNRYHSSPLTKKSKWYQTVPDDYDILGEEQWSWLEALLREDAARVNKPRYTLIASGVQIVADDKGFKHESWGQYPHSKQRLYNLLRDTKTAGVLLLSGDIHLSEIVRLHVYLRQHNVSF